MSTHQWTCLSCKREIGRVATNRHGEDHLYIRLQGVIVESTRNGHWVIECVCHRAKVFHGTAVHYRKHTVIESR